MPTVFCGQALASTECATSGQSATSQCLSALPGRPGRGKFVLVGLEWKNKNQRTYYSYTTTGDSAPLGVINTAVTRGRKEVHSRGGGGPARVRKNHNPHQKKTPGKTLKVKTVLVEVPSPPMASCARGDLGPT